MIYTCPPWSFSSSPSVSPSRQPLIGPAIIFHGSSRLGLDLEEIKNLCCFVVFPCGWTDVNKVLYYGLTHAHIQTYCTQDKKCTHLHPHILYKRLYIYLG